MIKKRTNIVCVDTQILSWALKPELQTDPSLSDNANRFLEYLEESKKRILIPTPVLTELTWYADEQRRIEVVQKITNRFFVKPFDTKASLICSEILNKYKLRSDFQEIKTRIGKHKLKYDVLIASVAIANDCECIYTNDGDYSVAEQFISIRDMLIIEEQLSLFGDEKIQKRRP